MSEFVEARNGGCYVAGTRISLDTVAYALRRGESPDKIFRDFPALGSRAILEGAIAYIRANQAAVDAYLEREEEYYGELRRRNPPPPALLEKIRQYREERNIKAT